MWARLRIKSITCRVSKVKYAFVTIGSRGNGDEIFKSTSQIGRRELKGRVRIEKKDEKIFFLLYFSTLPFQIYVTIELSFGSISFIFFDVSFVHISPGEINKSEMDILNRWIMTV